MKLLTVCLFLMASISLFAQTQVNPSEKISVDPNVRIGKLDNGMVYYIRKNSKPEKRVELRLAVNAGSILETEEQLGLAHFCEHMCFNGTKNFPKNELINTIEKMGIRFGADLNAYTGFDETVYMLQVPTDDPELVDKGFQILEDWAHNVSFDDAEIDKERGVIIEEWRLGLGADDRMRKKSFPVIFKGSRYADRVPIGKIEILQSFKYETLRDFYKTWYRSDLMAIVVVGDINVDEMEQKIKTYFGRIPKTENPQKREVYDLPDNDAPLISIETDPEAMSNSLFFFYKHPKVKTVTNEDYRETIVQELYTGMLNDRLNELGEKADAPFIFAGTSYGDFLARTSDAYQLYAQCKENLIGKTFELLLTENERVKRFGFTQTELDRQKQKMMTEYEKKSKEFDKTESARHAMSYVYNYLSGNPIPGSQKEFEMAKAFMPEIKLEDVNALAKKWITEKNLVIMITAPQKKEISVPSQEELLGIIKNISAKELTAYEDNVSADPLLAVIPAGSSVVKTSNIEELGVTEFILGNNVRVVLKKTDYKNNEIVFSGYSMGGTSLVPIEDYFSALFAANIIDEGGIAKFNKTELQKKLAGTDLEIYPEISDLKEGFRGKCSTADLETMLQLVYLYFTDPRVDEEAFKAFTSKMKSQLKFLSNNPQYAFYKKLVETITKNDPRSVVIPTEEQLDKIDLSKAAAFFKDRYADAGDFTFFLVGNFDPEQIKPLLEKYLGGLPTTGRKESFKDVSPMFPEGIVSEVVYKGVEEKGMVGLIWSMPFEWTPENILYAKVLTKILNIKLRESVREDEGGTYGLQVMEQMDKYPKQEFSLNIMFGCDPKKEDKLVGVIFKEMEKLIKNGPTQEDLDKVKETMIRERETDLKKNEWWIRKLENLYYYDDPKTGITSFNEKVKAVTVENIKGAAGKYFDMKHYVKVYLKPEKK